MNRVEFLIATLNNCENKLIEGSEVDSNNSNVEMKLSQFTTDYYDNFQNGNPKRTAQNLLNQIDNFIYNAKVELSRLEDDVKYDVLSSFKADTLEKINRISLQ